MNRLLFQGSALINVLVFSRWSMWSVFIVLPVALYVGEGAYMNHQSLLILISLLIHNMQYVFTQATGLDAWASRVKCPARFVSHLHDICICI